MTYINPVNEDAYENSVIELFEGMGYAHVYGPDIEDRDFYSPLYEDVLVNALYKINSKVNCIQNIRFAISIQSNQRGHLSKHDFRFRNISYTFNFCP